MSANGRSKDQFLVNLETGEIHHVPYAKAQCQLEEINNSVTGDDLALLRDAHDLCAWCFKSEENS